MNDDQMPRTIRQAQPDYPVESARTNSGSDRYIPAQQQSQDGSEIDIFQLFGALWQGKWVILVASFIALIVGGYYAFAVAVPEYSATARLALQSRGQQVVDLESVMSGVSTEQAAINTELEVIASRGLLEQLVTDLDLISDPEFNATLRAPSALSRESIVGLIKKYLPISFSEDVPPTPEEIRILTVDAVRKAINVTSQPKTYLLNIGVRSQNRVKSSEMANRLAQIYLDDQIAIKFSATEYAVDWLSGRVTDLELELKLKEDEIKDLRAETELVSLEGLEALNVRAKNTRDRLSEAQNAVLAANQQVDRLTDLASRNDVDEILAAVNDPSLSRVAEAAQNGNAAARRLFFSNFEALIDREKLRLERELSQKDALQTSYDRILQQVEEQNADLLKLNQLRREADATRVLYETFLTRLKETSVQIGLQQADSRILSLATPGVMVAPRRSFILVASLALGLLFGAAIVIRRQFSHDGFRTAEDLEKATGYTVLGQIPVMPIRRRGRLIDYIRTKTTSASAEAVRNLRTSILLSNIDAPPKVIMMTSSVPGEGKTTQAISLSHNLSGLGKKVLLAEGDIRRRTFRQYFDNKPPGSLISVVTGDQELKDAVLHDAELGIDVLMGDKSSGNAADLFSSDKFRTFLEKARAEYDFIIIDVPPVMVVPDSRVIGQNVDAIVYVVKWDQTSKTLVQDGLRQFSSIGLRVAGVVLSQIDARGMKRYGYGGKYGGYSTYGQGYYDVQ